MEADRHRAFVREIDRKFAQAYGYGGMSILLLVAVYGYGIWHLDLYTRFWPYVVGVTVVLLALGILSSVIRRVKRRFRARIDAYCQANGLLAETLLEYFEAENMYPYFAAVFAPSRNAEMELK